VNEYLKQAIEKLNQNGSFGQKADIMKHAVRRTLEDFCRQDEEFAQAVAQGGSFGDCMKKVAEGVGNSISDLDAYRKAVQFYFPGAEIRMQMTIDLIGAAAVEQPQTMGPMILDITQFL